MIPFIDQHRTSFGRADLREAELIYRRGPWRTVEQVELATAARVAWWNNQRLHSACGDVPPAEFEAAYDARQALTPEAA